MADRNRPLGLRSGAVPPLEGKHSALSNEDRARKALNLLMRSLPVKKFIVVPRNQAEAHHRADSICVLLNIPFRILGPLLFAASILVIPKRGGGLGFSQRGFDTLVDLYNRQPSYELCFVKKSLSLQTIAVDARSDGEPVTRTFFYIYRGQVVPKFCYVPLVASDLIDKESEIAVKTEELAREIIATLPSSVALLFTGVDQTGHARTISVDTTAHAENSTNPALITPTEGTLHPASPAIDRQQRIFHSPPQRTPGKSPPFQRLRRSETEPRVVDLVDEELRVETVEEENEEEEEEPELEPEPEPEPESPVRPTVKEEIEAALKLDFELRNETGKRPPRSAGAKPIHVGNRRQATEAMRTKIVWLTYRWGYAATALKKDKLVIAEAASRVVFYDYGFPLPPKGFMVATWVEELENARYNVETNFQSALENQQLGSQQGRYCSQIEAAFPGYLHEMYRKAGKNPHVTFRATFAEMADAMNEESKGDEHGRPELHLTRHTLKTWFHAWNGKVRKGWERPILTPERMAARVEWCKARKAEIAAAEAAGPESYHQRYYCFLDEKWFYIRSRRKKLKVLPRGPHEPEGAENIPMERESSRRHATKVMVLGVIADPVEEHGFDGKVYFTRVARNRKLQKSTYTDKIFDDLAANTALHRQWHAYVTTDQTAPQMIDFVGGTVFDMDEELKQRLVIRYKDHKENGQVRWKEFKSFHGNPRIKPKPDLPERPLDTRDLILQAKYSKDEEIPEDVSCDSEFMKEHMDAIGRAIRAKYHWVPQEEEIFLVMDNAGGHGTRDTIDKYVEDLLERQNVRVVWQEPRGPELNLLDLGAWMSLQSAVEKHFRGNRNDVEVLWRKIQDVWGHYDASVFRKIWDRWKLALDLIIADEGNNRLVNEHRGKLFTPAAPPPNQDAALPPTDDYDVDADNDDAADNIDEVDEDDSDI